MRYKGDNTITFSCDTNKNVTVVIGDNVGGKTTIAQAFRYALYGKVQLEKNQTESDIVLLNQEIIMKMDADAHADMWVELSILDDNVRDDAGRKMGNRIYVVRRTKKYNVKSIHNVKEYQSTSKMYYYNESDSPDTAVDIPEASINGRINTLFPRDFSPYFLFDGEKWSDPKANRLDTNIKASISKLTGLEATQNAMAHLRDNGKTSARYIFSSKIKGDGAFFDNFQREIDQLQSNIDDADAKIKQYEKEIKTIKEEISELERTIEQNKEVKQLQHQVKSLETITKSDLASIESTYKNMLGDFSRTAFYEFAKPMMKECLSILSDANIIERDIPHIHQSTIDYLIKRKECLCGCALIEGQDAYNKLMEERDYLPPANMGTLISGFKATATTWSKKPEDPDFKFELTDNAKKLSKYTLAYQEHSEELENLKAQLTNDVDIGRFEQLRQQKVARLEDLNSAIGQKRQVKIDNAEKIKKKEEDRAKFEKQNSTNAILHDCVDICNSLYKKFKAEYEEKENLVFQALNDNLKKNYQNMFNSRDKKIVLDDNYSVQMMYKTETGAYKVEKNLSEGEKIARNFAFVVSILEYNKTISHSDHDTADVLPLILDGPFSKLSDENIKNVSGVLPTIAEQVIVFTLEKDWKHTDLSAYTGATYRIMRPKDAISSRIEEV